MANCNVSDDVTSICSVCLELYKGRNPKLLPCFHTFCLPCLQDLEKHQTEISSDTKGSKDDKGNKRPLTFRCPTCRAVTTVPAGGVSQFQTNFYLSDKVLTCDVCDGGEDAMFACTECGHNMCNRCHRYLTKFLSNHHVQSLSHSFEKSSHSSLEPADEGIIADQLKVLEAALVTMREEEDMLLRERQAVADVISRRADAVRTLVSQAEERSQRALVEVTERLGKRIQEEMEDARKIHGKLFRLIYIAGRQYKDSDSDQQKRQTVLLNDYKVQFYQQRSNRGRQMKIMLHKYNDAAIDLKIVDDYIGTVSDGKQPEGETSNMQVSEPLCTKAQLPEEQSNDLHVTPQLSDTTELTSNIREEGDMLAVDTP